MTKFDVPGHRRCRPWEHRQCLCRHRRGRREGRVFSVHPKIKPFEQILTLTVNS